MTAQAPRDRASLVLRGRSLKPDARAAKDKAVISSAVARRRAWNGGTKIIRNYMGAAQFQDPMIRTDSPPANEDAVA